MHPCLCVLAQTERIQLIEQRIHRHCRRDAVQCLHHRDGERLIIALWNPNPLLRLLWHT